MLAERQQQLTIRTPEGIAFGLTLAGPVARFFALAIDLALQTVLFTLIMELVLLGQVLVGAWLQALATVLIFVLQIGYAMGFEWLWQGRTVGKWLLKLQVVDEAGLKLTFPQVALRNLLRFVDFLPVFYLVGGAACLVSARCQRLGDLAANTVVVRHPALHEPDLGEAFNGLHNSLRAFPHLCARLRQSVSPEEARIALQAVLRRESLEPGARLELFEELAERFRNLVPFPESATLGLSGEQYVRNCVEVIYRA